VTIDPVSGFVIVWTFLGSALAWVFRLIKMPRATAIAFLVALIPAVMVAAALSE
jgi:hypothetical protein